MAIPNFLTTQIQMQLMEVDWRVKDGVTPIKKNATHYHAEIDDDIFQNVSGTVESLMEKEEIPLYHVGFSDLAQVHSVLFSGGTPSKEVPWFLWFPWFLAATLFKGWAKFLWC